VEVRSFSTGRVRVRRATRGVRRYVGGDWSAETLPVNAFLVEHADGLCLFDTGQNARAAHSGYHPAWHPFLRLARFELAPEDELATQLRAQGVEPAAVRWVVLSHLHTDHIGGVHAFPQADVLVSRIEWERAGGLAGRLRGYLPQRWPHAVEPTLVDLTGPAIGPFEGSFDLAGDGSLVLVATPGHTPGHMGLVARDETSGVFLGGDVGHSTSELPREIAAFCDQERLTILLAHDESALR
jgi:glyoxylase-like metal-dependent hydrolase (beta-lactamase superfamily II)